MNLLPPPPSRLTAALALALCLTACGGGQDAEILAAGPDRVLDPGVIGPYAVGVRTVTVSDPDRDAPGGDGPRTLRLEIWYPAVESSRDLPRDIIDLSVDAPPAFAAMVEQLAIELPVWDQLAARDAEPRADQGLFPVVLFSHGNAAIRTQSFFLTTQLASHGYVVIAPDHPGNTIFDQLGLESTLQDAAVHAVNRPQDISFLIDALTAGSITGGDIERVADLSRIGVSGHSFGGYTSLIIGSYISVFSDDRVSALAPISPAVTAVEMVGGDVGFIEIPTLYVGGTDDMTTPYDTELVYGYERHALSPKGLVALSGAGHLSFADLCTPETLAIVMALDFPDDLTQGFGDGCGAGFADAAFVHGETNRYITAWFNTYLRDSAGTGSAHLDAAAPTAGVELRLAR